MIVPVPLSKLWVYENKSEGGKRGSEDLSQICAPPPPSRSKSVGGEKGEERKAEQKKGELDICWPLVHSYIYIQTPLFPRSVQYTESSPTGK